MLILKTINISNGISSITSLGMAAVLVLAGLAIIAFTTYIKIRHVKFKKNGVPVKIEVKEVKENVILDENNQEIRNGFTTTFEFVLNGIKREKTMHTAKKFKVGLKKDGFYDGKLDILSFEHEGFYLSKGASIFLISFGMMFLFAGISVIFVLPPQFVLLVFLIYFGLVLGIVYLYPRLFNKNKKSKTNNNSNQINYENINNKEYTITDSSSLVRYVPKQKKYNKKVDFVDILQLIITLVVGCIAVTFGVVGTYNTIKTKLTYPYTIGEIEKIYKYTQKDNDGTTSELTGIIYKYSVDGTEHRLDYKSGGSYSMNTDKIGDKEKLYYEKDNPNNAIPNSSLGVMVIPLVIGIVVIYIGIHVYIKDRRKIKLYETYGLKEEK